MDVLRLNRKWRCCIKKKYEYHHILFIYIYTHIFIRIYTYLYFWVFRSFAFVGDQHLHWLNKVKKPFFQAPCWFVAQKKDAGNIFDKQLHHIFEAFRLLRQPCHEDAFIPRARHGGPGTGTTPALRCRFFGVERFSGDKNGEQGSKTLTSCTVPWGNIFFHLNWHFFQKKTRRSISTTSWFDWSLLNQCHMKRSNYFRLLS